MNVSFFGSDGNPILTKYGYAGLESEFDNCGNQVKVSYFGTDSKPILSKNGIAGIEREFDEHGNPDARPLFHSDRGFQYTNRTFHAKLEAAGMTQSMSRVAHCIDNGPMEGFWGILKRERYYGRRFTSKEELMDMIHNYIVYYNNRRAQRNLGVLTPAEKHEQFYLAA